MWFNEGRSARSNLMPAPLPARHAPLRVAFLGCGFITRVHSRRLRAMRHLIVPAYASRDAAKARAFNAKYSGAGSYGDYDAAIADPSVDAVVVAVPRDSTST